MTRLAPLWQQNGTYPAATDRVLIASMWPTSGSTGGQPSLVAGTMNVSVAPGTAAVALSAGNYCELCRWDAAEVVTLAAGPPTGQTRIDLVILQVRDQAVDAGPNNDFVFAAVTGTPATSNPAVPAVPANAYAVCQVTVPALAANLNGATLRDRRLPLSPRDVLRADVYRAGAFTTATGPFSNVGFETVASDPYGMYQTDGFVVPVAGYYRLTSVVTVVPTAVGDYYAIGVGVNNTNVRQGTQQTSALAGAPNLAPTISVPILASAGQKLSVQHTSSKVMNGSPGQATCWASINYEGTG